MVGGELSLLWPFSRRCGLAPGESAGPAFYGTRSGIWCKGAKMIDQLGSRRAFLMACCLFWVAQMATATSHLADWAHKGYDYESNDYSGLPNVAQIPDYGEYLSSKVDERAEALANPIDGDPLFDRPKGLIQEQNNGKVAATAAAAAAAASAMLPAYCDPPNPCPIGYTAKDGCIEDFENTSDFSRVFQAEQKCICDNEHMFNCALDGNGGSEGRLLPPDHLFAALPAELGLANPFLGGQKLPVAAKKGIGF